MRIRKIFRLEWVPQADNELRMIVIAYGMTQMVREVFPSLSHIISEQHQQKNGIISSPLIFPIYFIILKLKFF